MDRLSRIQLATMLLDTTSMESLRKASRHNRSWASVYRGFRPNSLTRSVFLRGAMAFAHDPALMRSLANAFFDSLGIHAARDMSARWARAAEDTRLSDQVREACTLLTSVDFASLSFLPEAESAPPTADAELESIDSPLAPKPEGETFGADAPPRSDAASSESAPQVDAPDRAAREIVETIQPPSYVVQQVPIDLDLPADNVTQIQQAVTLFERALVQFIHRQLQGLYGSSWLRKGCGPWRQDWWARADRNSAIEPKTLLGYAEIAELEQIISRTENWPVFKAYFSNKDLVRLRFLDIVPLRVSGMHPSERTLSVVKQIAGLNAMVEIIATVHPPTARRIDELVQEGLSRSDSNPGIPDTARSKIQMNVSEFSGGPLVGRETQLRELNEFWDDPYRTVLSVTGEGGIGKTALLEGFLHHLVSRLCPFGERPDPELIVYLTAKEEYLPDMRRAPATQQVRTLRRIYDVTLETVAGQIPTTDSVEVLRSQVLSLARSMRIFYALDNLETLDDAEWDEIGNFLDELPGPSKAVVTTRVNRRVGRGLQLTGLTTEDGRHLFISRLTAQIPEFDANDDDTEAIDEIVRHVNGFPLAIVSSSNLVANGYSIRDALDKIKGGQTLELLQFSFESSLKRLMTDEVQTLLFLSVSKYPRAREELLDFSEHDDRLGEILKTLLDMSFIRRSLEDKKRVKFVVENPLLKDYVSKRAPELLSADEYALVLKRARIAPSQAQSASVLIEVEREIARARDADWDDGIRILEAARRRWGDEPRLIAELGYFYYRMQNRPVARSLLEKAIALGYESADVFFHLALVHFYDNRPDDALVHAETALTLRAEFPGAERLAADALLARVARDVFTLDDTVKTDLLRRATAHLQRALIADERGFNDEAHNRKVRELIARADEHLSTLIR